VKDRVLSIIMKDKTISYLLLYLLNNILIFVDLLTIKVQEYSSSGGKFISYRILFFDKYTNKRS
jgi:hypothetical protein